VKNVTNADFQAETMTDLQIADKTPEEAKGGRVAGGYTTASGRTTGIATDE